MVVIEFFEYVVVWWDQLCLSRRSTLLEISTWTKLKGIMRLQFVPGHYSRDLYQKLQTLVQRSQSVDECFREMEILMLRADIQEDKEVTMARFLNCLQLEIAKQVDLEQYMEVS